MEIDLGIVTECVCDGSIIRLHRETLNHKDWCWDGGDAMQQVPFYSIEWPVFRVVGSVKGGRSVFS